MLRRHSNTHLIRVRFPAPDDERRHVGVNTHVAEIAPNVNEGHLLVLPVSFPNALRYVASGRPAHLDFGSRAVKAVMKQLVGERR